MRTLNQESGKAKATESMEKTGIPERQIYPFNGQSVQSGIRSVSIFCSRFFQNGKFRQYQANIS